MEWKTIAEHPNYEISTTGLVRNKSSGYVKLPTQRPDGYLMINMGRNSTNQYIHRLMGQTFLANPDGRRTINHKNGNKQDNSLENLEWMTHGENNQHAYNTALRLPVANQPTSKRLQARNLRTGEVREFPSQRQASIELGLCSSAIRQCKVSPLTRRAGEWRFAWL